MSTNCIRRSGSQWTLCKCDDCRREMRRKVKLRRNGLPIITDQRDAARARIAGWAESGYSVGVIAQMTGIRKATLIPHILGTRTEISHATAKRIMGATELPETGGFILSVGTSRRLRALTVMGWSMSDLAARCELAESTLHALRDSKHRFTRPKYAKVVADLFDQLSMTRGNCRYAATRAIRKGWLPPVAWEDIDNPNENPSENVEAVDLDEVAVARLTAGDRVEATRNERLEALRELTEAGMSDSQCATRLRVTERTIQRWRLAHGIQSRWVA